MRNPIRNLARTNNWQTLYSNSKDLNGIKLFDNERDFSIIQLRFLRWLGTYNSMFVDLAIKDEGISEYVIGDEIREDAYLQFRDKKRDKKKSNNKLKNMLSGKNQSNYDFPTLVFEKDSEK